MSEPILIEVDEDLEDLVESYIAKRLSDRTEILEALKSDDFAFIQGLSHKMKGSGGGYGMDFISELGAECEKAAKAADKKTIEDWMEKLQDYFSRIEITYVEDE